MLVYQTGASAAAGKTLIWTDIGHRRDPHHRRPGPAGPARSSAPTGTGPWWRCGRVGGGHRPVARRPARPGCARASPSQPATRPGPCGPATERPCSTRPTPTTCTPSSSSPWRDRAAPASCSNRTGRSGRRAWPPTTGSLLLDYTGDDGNLEMRRLDLDADGRPSSRSSWRADPGRILGGGVLLARRPLDRLPHPDRRGLGRVRHARRRWRAQVADHHRPAASIPAGSTTARSCGRPRFDGDLRSYAVDGSGTTFRVGAFRRR